MTYVICVILGVQVHGVRLEVQGDKWLVFFHRTTEWVDSNRCRLESK